ncbi:Uncharacterised protein [Yersinia enterocolitica]|nr:hypothetical protein CH47_932 [Yersinia enterocolitica]KGA70756.1 hypothetical protein DJ59_1046 [Yersinia enterocolitica]CNJ66205.1 Uncharacterised protein [Yersinia enterocolitica]VFS96637.1 Uncharacterised protein [Yersinia enterocolitica]VTP79549.1 Uncharacterised protein [Yersinia enterocolitica subsp. enterocolitica]
MLFNETKGADMVRGIAQIKLDERWELKDFAIFSKEYLQVYDFYYSLRLIGQDSEAKHIKSSLPWKGGHSVVHFFNGLSGKVGPLDKPIVKKIQYASPGVIELQAVVQVAQDVAIIVSSISASILSIATLYHRIRKDYLARELSRIEIQEAQQRLDHEDMRFIIESVKELQQAFQLDSEQVRSLDLLSNGDQLVQLKMLMSLYRRAEPLAELQVQNKAKF